MKFKIMELWASLGRHLKPASRSNNQEVCQYHPHNVEQSSSVNLDASLYFCVIKWSKMKQIRIDNTSLWLKTTNE